MPELPQASEVLAPPPSVNSSSSSSSSNHPQKSSLLWRTLLQWVSFLFQILLQVLRGTPSLAHLALSHLGLRYSSLSPPPPLAPSSFKPLPPDDEEEAAEQQHRRIPPSADPVIAVDDPPLDKLTVVLDLDETLVCAYETSSLPDIVRSQAIVAGLKCFELDCISSEKEPDGRPKINHVTVFERPGLQEFLQQVSEFADLVLFTAGLEGYARPLVDRIDSEHRFKRRLYRPSTVTTEYREHVKDLSCLSKDHCRIVIVDNNPFSFLLQPSNGIPCIPFYAGQPHDEQLMGFILPLLKHLSLQKDVRPLLYDKFHMPEWFQKHGIPMSDWLGCDSPPSV